MVPRVFTRIIPLLGQLEKYSLASLRMDALAGLTVALVLIPQSMAYAQLAGLPAYYGLYAAFLPPLVAALFGSSRQLATGPVAVVSLMTAASLEPLASAGSPAFIAYALLLSLVVGLFQLALGLLRLGLVVNFLSHPVVNGFSNAAAIIIASSQLAKMFGVKVDTAEFHYQTMAAVVRAALHYTHWLSFFMGVLAFVIMYLLKRFAPRVPYVLAAVVVTTVISWAIGFEKKEQVPLGAIADQQVQGVIRAYNLARKRMARLEKDLADLNRGLQEARDRLGERSMTVLRLKHQGAMVDLLLEEEKILARRARASLRRYKLVRVRDEKGRVSFHLPGRHPPDSRPEKAIWRIQVGRGPLDEAAITLSAGGAVVGSVPSGLPRLDSPRPSLEVVLQLLPYAAVISLLGFMEAISIAKAMAARTGQRLDPNQELVGQGLANLVGAFSQSYPVSGSFSRSAVNLQAGARTGLSSVFSSLTVAVVLMFFTPVLYHLPQAVLAAVIMMAVVGLINPRGFIHAWRAQWYDGVIALLTFAATLFFAPHLDIGIFIGVGLSLLVFLYKSMRPRVAALAMAEDHTFHDVDSYDLDQCRRIAVIRFDGPLFFANASFLEEQIAERRRTMPELRHMVLVCDGISDMDASGEEALALTVDRLRSAGLKISLAGVHSSVLETMKRTHLLAKIGEENIYPTTADAIRAIHADAHQDMDEIVCPLLSVCHRGESEPEAAR